MNSGGKKAGGPVLRRGVLGLNPCCSVSRHSSDLRVGVQIPPGGQNKLLKSAVRFASKYVFSFIVKAYPPLLVRRNKDGSGRR
jgi:hypothetical protein